MTFRVHSVVVVLNQAKYFQNLNFLDILLASTDICKYEVCEIFSILVLTFILGSYYVCTEIHQKM